MTLFVKYETEWGWVLSSKSPLTISTPRWSFQAYHLNSPLAALSGLAKFCHFGIDQAFEKLTQKYGT